MPEEAVLDAATLDAPEIDSGVDTSVVDDSQVADDGSQGSEDSSTESTDSESLRGSALWREVKTLATEGKPLTQKQLSALNKIIHRDNELSTRYPDGFKAVESQLEAIQQLADDPTVPMDRVIQETLQERNYFRELDSLFTSGKPEFVDKMADASPEAFQNIAPSVFRKFSEVNPEGYSSYIAQVALSSMNSSEIPLQFRILASFLPQLPDSPAKEQVLNAVEAIFGWSEGLKAMATKPIAPKLPENTGKSENGNDSNLQSREMNVTRREWNGSVQREGVDFVLSEATKAAGKNKLTDKEKQTVVSKVGEELEARLSADRRYGETMQGYLKNGNRNAYIQRIQSERKKLIPGATRRAVDDVIAARPKQAAKPNGQAQPSTKKSAQADSGVPQYRRISGHPKTIGKQVDLNRTSHTMLTKRQAYLVGEKEPVQWG